jgi:hypothetical protein
VWIMYEVVQRSLQGSRCLLLVGSFEISCRYPMMLPLSTPSFVSWFWVRGRAFLLIFTVLGSPRYSSLIA